MSHHESGDRLVRQILLPLPILLDECPFGRSRDEDRTGCQCRPNSPHSIRRGRRTKESRFLGDNPGLARKMEITDDHGVADQEGTRVDALTNFYRALVYRYGPVVQRGPGGATT